MAEPLPMSLKILARHLVENGKTPYLNADDTDLPYLKPGSWHEFKVDVTGGSEVTTDGAFAVIEGPDFADLPEAIKREQIDKHKHNYTIPIEHFLGKGAQVYSQSKQAQNVREYARKYGMPNVWDIGIGGICHIKNPEEGFVLPGSLILWADSHTPSYGGLGAFAAGVGSTYAGMILLSGSVPFKVPKPVKVKLTGNFPPYVYSKDAVLYLIGKYYKEGVWQDAAIDYVGGAISNMSLEARITMANMAAEMEATTAIFRPDAVVDEYLNQTVTRDLKTNSIALDVDGNGNSKHYDFRYSKQRRARADWRPAFPDADAKYAKEIKLDVSMLEPYVAYPYEPTNLAPVSKVSGTEITKAFLGSCTNARFEDLEIAAKIIKGKSVAPGVIFKVVPASDYVLRQAERAGLLDVFRKAGARVADVSTCSWCIGSFFTSPQYAEKHNAQEEVVKSDDVVISTSNRNFPGRMGDPEAWVFLASPAVVAASAITGAITDPRSVMRKRKKINLRNVMRKRRERGQKFDIEVYG